MSVEILEQKMHIRALVESDGNSGSFYNVEMNNGTWECTCPDFQHRRKEAGEYCKHITQVKEAIA
jgi:hypothetical protein